MRRGHGGAMLCSMSAAPLPSRRPGAHPTAWLVTALLLAGLMACSESPAPPGSGPADEPAAATTAGDGPSADAEAGKDAPVAEAAADDAPPAGPTGPHPAPPSIAEPAPLPDLTGWLSSEGHLGLHTLAWRPLDHDTVPRNQEFSAEVLLLRDDAPAPGARLQVTGYMPAHAHGLVQMPVCEEVGEGRYRVDGLLLHMRGHWQVRFTIVADRQVETATFELDL